MQILDCNLKHFQDVSRYEQVIFIDNHVAGGVATFVNLLLPRLAKLNTESLVVINASYPQIENLLRTCPDSLGVITFRSIFGHRFFTRIGSYGYSSRFSMLFAGIRRLIEYGVLMYEIPQIRRKIPLRHGQNVLIVNGGYPGSYLALAAVFAWSEKCTVFLNCHSLASRPTRVFGYLERLLDHQLSIRTRAIVSNSLTTERSLYKRFRRNTPRTTYVYNSIEVTESSRTSVASKSLHANGPRAPIIGLIGTMEPRKGHLFALHLLHALHDCPDLEPPVLRMTGSDPYGFGNVINKTVLELDLVNFVRLTSFQDAEDLYRELDLVIMPSEKDESFGLVSIEALSRGIPVVASSAGALPEILHGLTNSTVVNGWEISDWVRAITFLLTTDAQSPVGDQLERLSRFCNPNQMAKEYFMVMKVLGKKV